MFAARDRAGTPASPRRVAAIALTASVHVMAVLVLLLPDSSGLSARPRSMLATFDAVNEGATKPAVHRTPQPRRSVPPPPSVFVAPPPEVQIPRLSPVVATALEQAEAQASNGGCDLTAPVQAALQASAPVQAVLLTIPQQRRSVANAIALWDQRWVRADKMLDLQSLNTIRSTITATIAAASPECRMAQQSGPRLIYVPSPTQTTVLALGSGQWTWQQVADSAQVDLAVDPDHVPVATIDRPDSAPPAAVFHP